MSLDDLEQALAPAKWGDAEEDFIEVISRALELPAVAVERVLYAAGYVRASRRLTKIGEGMDDGPNLSRDLREAIEKAMEAGARRVLVRQALEKGYGVRVPIKLLVKKPADVCEGCVFRMRCVMDGLSTPETCVKRGVLAKIEEAGREHLRFGPKHTVFPKRLRGDVVDVTCEHPRGEWTLNIADLDFDI